MQKNFLPKALGALFLVFFIALVAQAATLQTLLQACGTPLSGTTQTQLAYATPSGITFPQGQNYLDEVTAMGHFTWPLDQMPLKVFIDDGSGTPGYQDNYPEFMRKAFDEWQRISNSQLTWQEVSSPDQADIVCVWTANARPKGNGVEAGQTQTTIQRNPFTGGGNIFRARVSVLTSLMGRSFSDVDTYKTCLHEVGHALGLQGHSSTAGDIMYPVLNRNQTPYLKQRDAATITALYSQANGSNQIAQGRSYRQNLSGWGVPNYGRTPVRFSDLSAGQQQAVRAIVEQMRRNMYLQQQQQCGY